MGENKSSPKRPIVAISNIDFSYKLYESITECYKQLGVNATEISRIANKENYNCYNGYTYLFFISKEKLVIDIEKFKEFRDKVNYVPENRICSQCNKEYPLTQDYFAYSKSNTKVPKDYLSRWCKPCLALSSKKHYYKNKEKINSDNNLLSKYIQNVYKKADKINNKENNLTSEWILENIIGKNCIYCELDCNGGIDRIDNSKGHIIDNCKPCCSICNKTRTNKFTSEEFKLIGKVIKEIKLKRLEYGN